jgi:hypothetical protein
VTRAALAVGRDLLAERQVFGVDILHEAAIDLIARAHEIVVVGDFDDHVRWQRLHAAFGRVVTKPPPPN